MSVTNESFIPSTIRDWNKLDHEIRNLDSVSKLKQILKKPKHVSHVFHTHGPRKLNVILTQLRCAASFLNYDLFKVNIASDPACICGSPREDAYHYFFECDRYSGIRNILMDSLGWVPTHVTVNLDLFTGGSLQLTNEENILILNEVFRFIKCSKRFLIV